jgi:hypothetical protein
MQTRPTTTAEAPDPLLTSDEAVEWLGLPSRRMIHHYTRPSKNGGPRLIPDRRVGRVMFFRASTLSRFHEQLTAKRTASLGLLGAGIAVPEGGALPGYVGLAVASGLAGALVVSGLRGLRKRQQPAAPAMPAGTSWVELAVLEITASAVHVCPVRGRVYSAMSGEFWRSSFDGAWLFGQGARLRRIDDNDPVILRALDRRDGRERLSVVA